MLPITSVSVFWFGSDHIMIECPSPISVPRSLSGDGLTVPAEPRDPRLRLLPDGQLPRPGGPSGPLLATRFDGAQCPAGLHVAGNPRPMREGRRVSFSVLFFPPPGLETPGCLDSLTGNGFFSMVLVPRHFTAE